MFNREKREKDKATKAELKQLIKPRLTFEQKQEQRARRLDREAIQEDRNVAVAKRIRALHGEADSGESLDPNIATFGSPLLYVDALSSLRIYIQDQFLYMTPGESHRGCARWQVSGSHDKEFLGMAPTGRQVTFTGVTICTLTDHDTITQEYHYWDMVTLLQQIQAT